MDGGKDKYDSGNMRFMDRTSQLIVIQTGMAWHLYHSRHSRQKLARLFLLSLQIYEPCYLLDQKNDTRTIVRAVIFLIASKALLFLSQCRILAIYDLLYLEMLQSNSLCS